MDHGVAVRPMRPQDREAALDLWVEAWQGTYPAIDFAARRGWMDGRLDELSRGGSRIYVATQDEQIAGFVTINPSTGYLDQLVVAKARQRQGIAGALVMEAKRVSPRGIGLQVNQDNDRAVAFYRKHGFEIAGADVTRLSGAPTYRMSWRA